MRSLQVLLIVGALGMLVGTPIAAESPIPTSVSYDGTVMDATGKPLHGSHDIAVRYLNVETREELYRESLGAVEIVTGSFTVELGTGEATGSDPAVTLQRVFEKHAEVYVEIAVDGQAQHPWVHVVPAGHSPATIAALSTPVGVDDDNLHGKAWEARSKTTGIQAVILGPADENAAGPVAMDSDIRTHPMLVEMTFLGESIPVRELQEIDMTPKPLVEPTEINRPRHEDLYDENGNRFGTMAPTARDTAVDLSAPVGASPPTILNFDGLPNISGFYPPDTEGTVGPNHYVQATNVSFAIYDKSGAMIEGPFLNNTLWSGFGGACETGNQGDPIFVYDEMADRFVLTQFNISNNLVCFAVSTTPDPTGSFYLYSVSTVRFPDYYKLGVWPVAENNLYMMTTNTGFQGQYDVYALDRASMLAGTTPEPAQRFFDHPNLLMPADVDGPTPPPAGSPGLMYTFRAGGEAYFGNPPNDSIDVWEMDIDWVTPANSTFANVQSFIPPTLVDFNWTVCGFFVSNCLPQPDTAVGIDSASWWPMQRLVYRNFGTHETMVGAWTVDVNGSPDLAGVRWFELRRSIPVSSPEGSPWTLYQQGTHSPDSTHRFMPSIGIDRAGNIALGYSVTSGSIYPSIRYAVRSTDDPLGALQTETEMMTGTGSQTGTANRWGDYSTMELDPADDCTFWYSNEYLQVTGGAPWKTRVATFQIPGCLDAVHNDDFESGDTDRWDVTVP